jgi:hypothetical protein
VSSALTGAARGVDVTKIEPPSRIDKQIVSNDVIEINDECEYG